MQDCQGLHPGEWLTIVTLRSGSSGVAMVPDGNCTVRFFAKDDALFPWLVSPINPGWTEADYAVAELGRPLVVRRFKVRLPDEFDSFCVPNDYDDTRTLEDVVVRDTARTVPVGQSATVWLPRVCQGDPEALVLLGYPPNNEQLVTILTRDKEGAWKVASFGRKYPLSEQLKRTSVKRIVVTGKFYPGAPVASHK